MLKALDFKKLYMEKMSKQQNKEFKQQVMNHTLGAMKFSKWFLLIPIVMFVLVFSIIAAMGAPQV